MHESFQKKYWHNDFLKLLFTFDYQLTSAGCWFDSYTYTHDIHSNRRRRIKCFFFYKFFCNTQCLMIGFTNTRIRIMASHNAVVSGTSFKKKRSKGFQAMGLSKMSKSTIVNKIVHTFYVIIFIF